MESDINRQVSSVIRKHNGIIYFIHNNHRAGSVFRRIDPDLFDNISILKNLIFKVKESCL